MKVLVAGDFCPRYRLEPLIENNKYEDVFHEVKDIVHEADYAIVNFECPVVEHDAEPIKKCGPNLRCTAKAVEAIQYAGFDCSTLANNHIADYGNIGIDDTIKALSEKNIDIVGGGENIAKASKILYKDINGRRLAIINCCEHEFSIATETTAGANPLNPVRQFYDIQDARKHADHVLVIVHGGHEHYQLPSPRMVETYRFFIDAGADAVVNHHQHCYSGYETYKGKPIFYGIGNFCFDTNPIRKDSIWNYGYMVEIDFNTTISFQIHPYRQCGEEAIVKLLPLNSFDEKLNEFNQIIANPSLLQRKTKEYYASCERQIRGVFNPITNKYIRALQNRNLLPGFKRNKWLVTLNNYIICEAHRDKVQYYLEHRHK